jgi:AcrR family transcriptional regulator
MTPSTARGRPRTFDTELVLEEALELFWRGGFRSTTLRDLEERLGLSQSSIYNAFGSKEDLLEAALDVYERRLDEHLLRPLEESDDGLPALDRFLASLGRWVTHGGRRGCMVINMMAEDGGATADLTRRTRRYRRRVRRALAEGLRRAEALGEVPVEGSESRADLLMGVILGLNIAARGGAPRRELDRLLEAARLQLDGWRVD